jgi:tRNA A37 threonylcarbamoyladenosine biosynthesis protein TsaE
MTPPRFKCEARIGAQIEYPLPSRSYFMTLIGSVGSGKTSLMVNMLRSPQCDKKAYPQLHFVIPPHFLASLDTKMFKKHDKCYRCYDELDFATLDKIHEIAMVAADENELASS